MFKGAVTGALCLAVIGSAGGQDAAANRDSAARQYPAKPVRIVVPYAAGGGTDALARFLAQGLERQLGQPFIIENRAGQGTATGGAYVARSAPDGYTLLAATSSTLAFNRAVRANRLLPIRLDFQIPPSPPRCRLSPSPTHRCR
jgi:tripartite-type tricarboxylate transporter receptor subunit TctC